MSKDTSTKIINAKCAGAAKPHNIVIWWETADSL
jgi:hypothetical protein